MKVGAAGGGAPQTLKGCSGPAFVSERLGGHACLSAQPPFVCSSSRRARFPQEAGFVPGRWGGPQGPAAQTPGEGVSEQLLV